MTTRSLTLADYPPEPLDEPTRQALALERRYVGGRQPCCGATNLVRETPIHYVFIVSTGCDACGHSLGCHA